MLQYWKEISSTKFSNLPSPSKDQFITFELDQGGLNNIRMAFEYIVAIAAVTGRTLVLPPVQPWYLLDYGPMHQGLQGGVTQIGDIFNVDLLEKILPVITAEEFIQGPAMDCIQAGDSPDISDASTGFKNWYEWCRNHGYSVNWHAIDTLICWPSIESVKQTSNLTDAWVDNRELVEFQESALSAKLIHFPSNTKNRQLAQVATMFSFENPDLFKEIRRLLKNFVCYVPEVFEISEQLIGGLPGEGYNSLHIRRNDFQYESSRASAAATIDNSRNLLEENFPLYIATDETQTAFFDTFGREYSVFCWDDFFTSRSATTLSRADIPEKLVGPIEQVICAYGQRFIGTKLSTFSSYITRLKGYLDTGDTNVYFLTEKYAGPLPRDFQPKDLRGKSYLREYPVMWLDC